MLDRDLNPSRFQDAASEWQRSFSLATLKVLVVCRGPVRLEAFEIFERIGVSEYGMLLSEKDSVVYPRCLAPELRSFRFPNNVHRVPDYMGVGQGEKRQRIAEIIEIAKTEGYTHLFAGYGFMAEDADFIQAIEDAGLGFLGPSSAVVRRAGAKDEAKKLARELGNAVIPGVDDISSQALLKKAGGRKGVEALASEHGLELRWNESITDSENAEALLQAGYAAHVELVTIPELQAQAEAVCAEMWADYPSNRIRFKHIGGGGGKGQRVVASPHQIPAAVMDILAESKVVEPGSNRNFLVELNIESTRHNEIQLIGNGSWCLSLGGRDCSVQMHEQKLVEVSLTKELLEAEAKSIGGKAQAVLEGDIGTLARMESEGERFGEATGLDSVSTFECIVEGFNHFFMEMNTRIQVEHGVTELAYRLKFTNPDDPKDYFFVEELIEAMALLGLHGERVPKPERVVRSLSGLEVRINATNQALQPHAGGMIRSWTPPIEGEIRFDQGIGVPNPDTGSFVYYNLAGAYDSNVALVLTDGPTRHENYERMAEVLRRMELRGDDLQTNLDVHYGLINWFLGQGVMAEPNTRFMASFLAAVGALRHEVNGLDLDLAATEVLGRLDHAEAKQTLAAQETLLKRPLAKLFARPHSLAGFLGRYDGVLWEREGDDVHLATTPIAFLDALYRYLDMEERPDVPPSEKIWDHDEEILAAGRAFYRAVAERAGATDWAAIEALFSSRGAAKLCDGDEALWRQCQASHRGFSVGVALLMLIPRIGIRSEFLDVTVSEELLPVFPERFLDAERMQSDTRALAPAPRASADEIVTPMGGNFYSREAPHLPPLIEEGQHFDEGQPLFIIEVMKMFNKVVAPFAGTVTKHLMAGHDGAVVKKGEPILKIEPDERIEEESPEARDARIRAATLALLG